MNMFIFVIYAVHFFNERERERGGGVLIDIRFAIWYIKVHVLKSSLVNVLELEANFDLSKTAFNMMLYVECT